MWALFRIIGCSTFVRLVFQRSKSSTVEDQILNAEQVQGGRESIKLDILAFWQLEELHFRIHSSGLL